jgi:Uma2 family endonuclease
VTIRAPFRPITTDLYRQMPEGPPYYQLIEGNLLMSPSANFHHQDIAGFLYRMIGNYLDDHPIGKIVIAPSDVFLDDINVFQPDLYYVRNEQRDVLTKDGAQGAPSLVVEILSPSTATRDRNEKRVVYARSGVGEMWIIDPEMEQIEVHALARGLNAPPLIIRRPDSFAPTLFPGLTIDTDRLFKRTI